MLRFSFFGFPVAVHWMFWVSAALLGGGLDAYTPRKLFDLALWVAAAFVSVLLHEFGHTLMQRRYGARARRSGFRSSFPARETLLVSWSF